jgi:hypothetical protein
MFADVSDSVLVLLCCQMHTVTLSGSIVTAVGSGSSQRIDLAGNATASGNTVSSVSRNLRELITTPHTHTQLKSSIDEFVPSLSPRPCQ